MSGGADGGGGSGSGADDRGSVADDGEQTRLRPTSAKPQDSFVAKLPLPTDPELPIGPGSVLGGRYRLIRALGEGGMGVVFLAEGVVDDQQFAVKVLGAAFRQHPDAVRALREEARKSLALRHANIVAVYPLERDESIYYLPMEFLDGKTLRALLDEDFVRGMPLQQAWWIIRGVGAALSFAHDRGVIHSDLKPSNIFVTTGGSARVLDFGIARAMRGGDRKRFDAGTLGAVTEAYASCEMMAQEPPTQQDDVYGLACVVYELLSGNHPFGGRSAAAAQEANLAVAPIPALNSAQNAALRRGLSLRRADRSASVEEFLAPLEPAAPGGGAGSKTVVAWSVGIAAIAALAAFGWWRTQTQPPPGGNAAREAATLSPSAPTAAASAAAAPRSVAAPAAQTPPLLSLPAAGAAFVDCDGCPRMVVLPAGQFRLSASKQAIGAGPLDLPQRLVSFADRFAIGEFPVTRQQFRAFLVATGYKPRGRCGDPRHDGARTLQFLSPGFFQAEDHPAVCVGVDDAAAFADWLTRKVGQGVVYRLPTEAEWEYAAHGGAATAYPWGETETEACQYGNFDGCSSEYRNTAPVGRFKPNPYRLYDMVGNVRQWTRSCLHEASPGQDDGSASIACAPQTMIPAVRGAAFKTPLGHAATAIARRVPLEPGSATTDTDVGFRVLRAQ